MRTPAEEQRTPSKEQLALMIASCSGRQRQHLVLQCWGASVDKIRDRDPFHSGACLQRRTDRCCIRLHWQADWQLERVRHDLLEQPASNGETQ
jgi:hypothetical protein